MLAAVCFVVLPRRLRACLKLGAVHQQQVHSSVCSAQSLDDLDAHLRLHEDVVGVRCLDQGRVTGTLAVLGWGLEATGLGALDEASAPDLLGHGLAGGVEGWGYGTGLGLEYGIGVDLRLGRCRVGVRVRGCG